MIFIYRNLNDWLLNNETCLCVCEDSKSKTFWAMITNTVEEQQTIIQALKKGTTAVDMLFRMLKDLPIAKGNTFNSAIDNLDTKLYYLNYEVSMTYLEIYVDNIKSNIEPR